MATYWVTEALPLAITALLPIVLFPVLGVLDGAAVTAAYFAVRTKTYLLQISAFKRPMLSDRCAVCL